MTSHRTQAGPLANWPSPRLSRLPFPEHHKSCGHVLRGPPAEHPSSAKKFVRQGYFLAVDPVADHPTPARQPIRNGFFVRDGCFGDLNQICLRNARRHPALRSIALLTTSTRPVCDSEPKSEFSVSDRWAALHQTSTGERPLHYGTIFHNSH